MSRRDPRHFHLCHVEKCPATVECGADLERTPEGHGACELGPHEEHLCELHQDWCRCEYCGDYFNPAVTGTTYCTVDCESAGMTPDEAWPARPAGV